MRIVHALPTLEPGGVTSVALDLARSAGGRHDVAIGVLRPGDWDARAQALGLEVFPLLRSARTRRADVIHAHQRIVGLQGALLGQGAVVEHVHNVISGHRLLSYRGDRVIAVANHVSDHLRREYPRVAAKLDVIWNGVSAPVDPRTAAERSTGAIDVIGVGRLVPQKDPLRFLGFVARLRDEGVDVRASWIGDGPLSPQFDDAVAALRLHPVVTRGNWIGREQLAERLRAADLLALSSRWEGLPLVGLEALSVGTPVLTTEIGDLSDTLRRDLDMPRFDAPVAAVTAWLARPELRTLAYETWRRDFSVDVMARHWEALYDRL